MAREALVALASRSFPASSAPELPDSRDLASRAVAAIDLWMISSSLPAATTARHHDCMRIASAARSAPVSATIGERESQAADRVGSRSHARVKRPHPSAGRKRCLVQGAVSGLPGGLGHVSQLSPAEGFLHLANGILHGLDLLLRSSLR